MSHLSHRMSNRTGHMLESRVGPEDTSNLTSLRPRDGAYHPPASSGCVDTRASLSTPLALAALMPRPRTHYLYYRLDID